MEPYASLGRRDFMRRGAGVLTGVIAAGAVGSALAPARAWAADLSVLTSAQGATLLAMTKTIAPHDRLDDAAYAIVVKSIDADLQQDAGKKVLLLQGIEALDAKGDFAALPEGERVEALRAIEPTPFFQSMRVDTLQRLYSTPFAYALFGYEGESFSKGGYLRRGFNDLRWLPDPPPSAAGTVPA